MSIHKLHIFAKNRDAVAAQKGYAFQQYKTLEDWIENRIANNEEELYCDYEDDILSRDLKAGVTKFKQIKLYSTDFSFSTEGIKKALAHFFMMYVKGEYAFDETEFFFETNASIVQRDVRGNDAELLNEWYVQQGNIDPNLLKRISGRVKKIIDEYIEESLKELNDKDDLKSDIQKAKIIYDNLKEEDFEKFVKCIKWQFDGIDVNTAVDEIVARIETLIPKIPLGLDDQKTQIYVALLIKEVYQRSIKDDPEERKLNGDLLDSVLLSAGEKEEQWYAEILLQFRGVKITSFFPGEFQSAVSGARYCRWNLGDEKHKSFWLDILRQYIELNEIPVENKRKAIYEYLFLKIGNNPTIQRENSPIVGDIELLKFYIEQWAQRRSLRDIEDDISLLQIGKAQSLMFSIDISYDELLEWQNHIKEYLDSEIKNEKIIDRLCELLEIRGHLAKQEDILNPDRNFDASFDFYRKIPPLLDKANLYSLSHLYDQMSAMIKMITALGIRTELIESTEDFMSEIQSYAERTGLRHKAAHDLIERGVLHLKKHNVSDFLKALELFHRAKGLWRLEDTKEGYILALLNISQVYLSVGMSYAAKYYALTAFWSCWHFADPALYKRLPQAFAFICASDFSHGAWMSAIDDFEHYLFSKRQFDERGFKVDDDEMYTKTIIKIAQIMHAIPVIHPEMSGYMLALQKKFGFVWEEQLLPLTEEFTANIHDESDLKKILKQVLRDYPLSDVGKQRTICFNALNIEWKIECENNETMTPIFEEFAGFLQIFLCEIARLKNDLFNALASVNILVKEGHFQKEYHGNDSWTITIPSFDSNEDKEVQEHYAYLGALIKSICIPVSRIPKQEFNKFYIEQLLDKNKFGSKAIAGASYQRVFKNSIGLSLDWDNRSAFNSLPTGTIPVTFPKYLVEKKG